MSADAKPVEPLLIGDREAARMCNISRASLHKLRAGGKWGPEAIRLGRALRFRKAEVESWIQAGAPPTEVWRAMQGAESRRARRVVG